MGNQHRHEQEQAGQNRDPFDNPMLLRQYLLSMLGFPSAAGQENGRMGDYVFSQEGRRYFKLSS